MSIFWSGIYRFMYLFKLGANRSASRMGSPERLVKADIEIRFGVD